MPFQNNKRGALMKKTLSVIFLFAFAVAAHAGEVDNAMKELSAKIIASYRKLPDAKRQKFVAVMDFQNRSMLAVRNNLGVAFSEILAQYLLRYRGELRIIERKQIESIIREKELKMTGIAEGGDASSYGEVLGADLLLIGSVFDAAGEVRVNVRVVETGKSEVLLNESVTVDRRAFVKTAKRYVKVTHTVSAGYMYQTIDDYLVNTFYAMYTYNFFYGLALNFQVFYGYSDDQTMQFTYKDDMGTYKMAFDKKFEQIGFSILFSKSLDLIWGFNLTPYAGPLLINYMEKSKLMDLRKLGSAGAPDTVYNFEPISIFSSYSIFGIKAGIILEYRISLAYKLFVGTEYQYFPEYKIDNSAYWRDVADAKQGTISWRDTIKLTGYSITAGAAYSF